MNHQEKNLQLGKAWTDYHVADAQLEKIDRVLADIKSGEFQQRHPRLNPDPSDPPLVHIHAAVRLSATAAALATVAKPKIEARRNAAYQRLKSLSGVSEPEAEVAQVGNAAEKGFVPTTVFDAAKEALTTIKSNHVSHEATQPPIPRQESALPRAKIVIDQASKTIMINGRTIRFHKSNNWDYFLHLARNNHRGVTVKELKQQLPSYPPQHIASIRKNIEIDQYNPALLVNEGSHRKPQYRLDADIEFTSSDHIAAISSEPKAQTQKARVEPIQIGTKTINVKPDSVIGKFILEKLADKPPFSLTPAEIKAFLALHAPGQELQYSMLIWFVRKKIEEDSYNPTLLITEGKKRQRTYRYMGGISKSKTEETSLEILPQSSPHPKPLADEEPERKKTTPAVLANGNGHQKDIEIYQPFLATDASVAFANQQRLRARETMQNEITQAFLSQLAASLTRPTVQVRISPREMIQSYRSNPYLRAEISSQENRMSAYVEEVLIQGVRRLLNREQAENARDAQALQHLAVIKKHYTEPVLLKRIHEHFVAAVK